MHAARILILVPVLAAACSASSPEPKPVLGRAPSELPDLVVSASCLRVEDTKRLAVAVSNPGKLAAAPSVTRVDIDADAYETFVHRTRAIAVRSFDTFEFDLPVACSRADCRWKITVDSANQVIESDETNNIAAGRC
jgi:subtilase family serine protease